MTNRTGGIYVEALTRVGKHGTGSDLYPSQGRGLCHGYRPVLKNRSIRNLEAINKLEIGGVLISRTVGRTRPYSLIPRYPFRNELKNLLEEALSFYPEGQRERLLMDRRRPRRRGKPL